MNIFRMRQGHPFGVAILGIAMSCGVAAAPPVRHWAPAAISSPLFESHGAFDYARNEFFFVRSSRKFRGWRIMVSHCGESGWDTPVDASFAGDGVEADPFITPDGKHLYFISTRSTDGQRHKDLDIWRTDRQADGNWGEPLRLPEPVNSRSHEWFPRLAADGWMYFGSGRPGGFGKTDIWRARQDASGKWMLENAGPAINTPADEYEALPSPDGRRLIVEADAYYVATFKDGRWTQKRKLGPVVNVNGSEIGAVFSPSGKSLLFARDTKGALSGEFFLWQPDGPEAWPPVCRDRKFHPGT